MKYSYLDIVSNTDQVESISLDSIYTKYDNTIPLAQFTDISIHIRITCTTVVSSLKNISISGQVG